ncbi:hypothetical protein ACIQRS_24860 [Streptomyces termitum]|uniref:DUF4232 domain-containing protein n=1 Tax=Streptomyces termitum TaxID=67368 RepID=A0A918T6I5_9ACTN|nr:hypothetical protein [Streptomyces termitum]GHA97024.1 hypothetical protein GCM10010305_45720 [Streptomyces termitum]
MSRGPEQDGKRDERGGHEQRHDPDERVRRLPGRERAGRDDLSGRLMKDNEPGPGGDGGDDDEPALRRLLHGAVAGLEPSTDALDHLRHAVPARRARKRQALVGAAAAVVLVGTAVPALVHVAGSPGLTAAHPVNAGHGEQAQGGTGAEADTEGPAGTRSPAAPTPPAEGTPQGAGQTGDLPGPGATGTAPGVTAPRCAGDALKVTGVGSGNPDAKGTVYGGFTLVNASTAPCLVDGDGLVGVRTSGAADPGRISVVRHSAGDPADGLPDPSGDSSSLLLAVGDSYQVKFAWVPSATCPTTGTTPSPTASVPPPTVPTPTPTAPTPTPSGGVVVEPTTGPGGEGTPAGGTEPGGKTGTDTGMSAQLLRGGPATGGITVSHTAEPGSPSAETVLPDACAGTVYRTGLLKN